MSPAANEPEPSFRNPLRPTAKKGPGAATANADRVQFRHFFRDREQSRHRTKRTTHVILIESRRDHANSFVGELHADIDDARIEKLHFIDADDLHADFDARHEIGARRHRHRFQSALVARNDFIDAETIVELRFENLHSLTRQRGAPHTANQLLRFTGEHASGDDLDPAAAMSVQWGFLRCDVEKG